MAKIIATVRIFPYLPMHLSKQADVNLLYQFINIEIGDRPPLSLR